MGEYQYSFEKLEVWKDARAFVSDIYRTVKRFPADEKFVLVQQICRAAISVPSNIAEGVTRSSSVEKMRFVNIAYASLMEVYCQLCIALDLKYITDDEFASLKQSINKISYKLTALNKAYQQQKNLTP